MTSRTRSGKPANEKASVNRARNKFEDQRNDKEPSETFIWGYGNMVKGIINFDRYLSVVTTVLILWTALVFEWL